MKNHRREPKSLDKNPRKWQRKNSQVCQKRPNGGSGVKFVRSVPPTWLFFGKVVPRIQCTVTYGNRIQQTYRMTVSSSRFTKRVIRNSRNSYVRYPPSPPIPHTSGWLKPPLRDKRVGSKVRNSTVRQYDRVLSDV